MEVEDVDRRKIACTYAGVIAASTPGGYRTAIVNAIGAALEEIALAKRASPLTALR